MSTNKNLYTLFFSTFDKFCACHNIINVKGQKFYIQIEIIKNKKNIIKYFDCPEIILAYQC
ncbi:hypothetical protein [Plasmodium yoelii yoelii]|uniref:Uncharacterized protein n=1 Tax=Plasmodium yoelii yoelii TaxID=73239 RepID=Q7RL72_PLAYO|nr:hypothetical protein [Plasmodium yoelii yoelii]